MKIKIYQIENDRDEKRVKFLRFDSLEKFQGSSKVNPEIYDLVYSSDVECKSLEDVFQMFNIAHPEDFKGHSLSVSDVVEVCEASDVKKGFYFCDSFGFKEIEFDSSKCKVNERFNKKIEGKIADAKERGDISEKDITDKEIEL